MAQCQRIIETGLGDRRCARDATRHAGDMLLCWQHHDALEQVFTNPLLAQIERLKDERDLVIEEAIFVPPPDRRLWTVYIARAPHITPEHPRWDQVKIGRTRNLEQRMDTLGLEAILSFAERPAAFETDLHRRFAHLCVDGEWFRLGPELADLFQAA